MYVYVYVYVFWIIPLYANAQQINTLAKLCNVLPNFISIFIFAQKKKKKKKYYIL